MAETRVRVGIHPWVLALGVVIVILLTCCCLLIVGIGQAAGSYDKDPAGYSAKLLAFLSSNHQVTLSDDNRKAIQLAGYNPDRVQAALFASYDTYQRLNKYIDPGILISIDLHEGGAGTNMGSYDARKAACSNPHVDCKQQTAAINDLMKHWCAAGVQNTTPASSYLRCSATPPTYLGHQSTGESGSGGFIPSTALLEGNRLVSYPDPDVRAWNVWNVKVGMVFVADYLAHCPSFIPNAPYDQAGTAMGCWNSSETWDQTLVQDAIKINALLRHLHVEYKPSDMNWWQQGVYYVLDALNLVPDDVKLALLTPGDWRFPLDREGFVYISKWPAGTSGVSDVHINQAVDLSCVLNAPVYAVNSGVVDKTPGSDPDYGNVIWLWHQQDGVGSGYAHLNDIFVEPGHMVYKGEVIGLCGSTGNSTGPHVHFMVYHHLEIGSSLSIITEFLDTLPYLKIITPPNAYPNKSLIPARDPNLVLPVVPSSISRR